MDDAAAMRAATIREAEEKMRLAQEAARAKAGGRAGAAGAAGASFDQRRTVEDARRKAHLIKEARRKRRQRLEDAEAEVRADVPCRLLARRSDADFLFLFCLFRGLGAYNPAT